MRPAVHASILRNRSQRSRRVMRPHSFSMRRLLLLSFVGALLFIPGIVLTIVGFEKTADELSAMAPGQRIMYQAIGPGLCTLGVLVLFSACIYYYCFGTGDSLRFPGSSHQGSVISDHEHNSLRKGAQGAPAHLPLQNDSQVSTPEGSLRRSFKEMHLSGRANSVQRDEENVPLASADHTSGDSQSKTPSAVAIIVDENTCADDANGSRESGHVGNGELHAKEPAA